MLSGSVLDLVEPDYVLLKYNADFVLFSFFTHLFSRKTRRIGKKPDSMLAVVKEEVAERTVSRKMTDRR